MSVSMSAADEAALLALGVQLAQDLRAPAVIYLCGDLGAGKTTFSRGLIQALGHSSAVKSPTYTLVEPYSFTDLTVYHFDLYRLGDAEELEFMGIRDYFTDNSVCLIEWPERGAGILPAADLVITIEVQGEGRRLQWRADTAVGEKLLTGLSQMTSQELSQGQSKGENH